MNLVRTYSLYDKQPTSQLGYHSERMHCHRTGGSGRHVQRSQPRGWPPIRVRLRGRGRSRGRSRGRDWGRVRVRVRGRGRIRVRDISRGGMEGGIFRRLFASKLSSKLSDSSSMAMRSRLGISRLSSISSASN